MPHFNLKPNVLSSTLSPNFSVIGYTMEGELLVSTYLSTEIATIGLALSEVSVRFAESWSTNTGSISMVGTATSMIFVTTKVLSPQMHVCGDKHLLVMTKHIFCCDKSMLVATTNTRLSRQIVMTEVLSKHMFDKNYTCGSSRQ